MKRANSVLLPAALAALWCTATVVSAITIGAGPAVGTDKRGTTWYEQFQDWTVDDLKALDTNNDEYQFGSYDTGRDMIAFYAHDDGINLYFRIDFYELGYEWEKGEVDVYVGIDCASGGQAWFPNSTEFQTDHPWEACVAVYETLYADLFATDWSTHNSSFLGSYWHSELDAVEFGIDRTFLTARGWDGNLSSLNLVPVSMKDSTDISGRADVVDHFGLLTPDVGDGNGLLEGAIAGDATAGRAKYALIAHANQSVNTRISTQAHIYTNRSDINMHPGFIRLLDTAEMYNLPINLHISGTLMMSFLWAEQDPADSDYPDRDGPYFMARCRDFVTTGPGSLIGGVLAEHIMPYFEGEVNQKSIEQNSELIQHYFGLSEQDMAVMHVPERVIRSNTNHAHVSASDPLDGKTFEEIENSGFAATYLDEVTHLHWWFYPNETNNAGWDDYNSGRWAGGQGNDEEPYHHKVHKINGVYTFMINDREDQSKFGNDDGGMAHDTRYTLLQKALDPDQAQITITFDDWEALAGNSFASPDPNNNADQIHNTLRWAANHPWIELKNLKDVLGWATNHASWVIDQGYVYDKTSQTYEWLKRASEHTYDHWYYGGTLEENFFNRTSGVHSGWAPTGMKKYGDMNTPGTLIRDSWDTIQSITSPTLKKLSEWAYSAMIYETAWHDEDADPDQYKSRNYQVTFDRGPAQGNADTSVADTTYDETSGWALKLHGHVRDMGVMKAASDWIENIKNGSQTAATTVYAADIDDDQLEEYVLCNDKVFLCIERWGARLIKAFVYDPYLYGGDARMVIGAPVSNPSDESEQEYANNNRNSVFKDHWSTGQTNNGYIDMDFASPTAPSAGSDSWTFTSQDGRIIKTIRLPAGLDAAYAHYSVTPDIGTLYVRNGLGPNQVDLMFNGAANLTRYHDESYRGLKNAQGGEVYLVGGRNAEVNTGSIADSGWDNRNSALTEIFEAYNPGGATNFALAAAFSQATARDSDGDGLSNTNEWIVGTDSFNPDTDGDSIPDPYEVANSLDPLDPDDAGIDSDSDGMLNWQEYIAGTLSGNSNSFFFVADSQSVNGRSEIPFTAQSNRFYQIYFADVLVGSGWNWQPFARTNAPVGSYRHAAAAATHTFTDDFTAATSGYSPTNGLRLYRIQVRLP